MKPIARASSRPPGEKGSDKRRGHLFSRPEGGCFLCRVFYTPGLALSTREFSGGEGIAQQVDIRWVRRASDYLDDIEAAGDIV